MNTFMKLTVAALGAASIAGGVALAQDASTSTLNSSTAKNYDGRSDTANYGTPAGAPLKRDGSLSADPKPAMVAAPMTDSSSTTTTTTQTTTMDAAPAPAPMVDAAPAPTSDMATEPAPAPRADRN